VGTEYLCLRLQGETGKYSLSKAKFSPRILIAQKYHEGSVQSSPVGWLGDRQAAIGEPDPRTRSCAAVLILLMQTSTLVEEYAG
jgi:hypothetical protein